ncbi:MAG: ABC transporter substrate-binding protein [Candidatus Lustribacter sp.]|jgi:NitT/TauT family transport system substrate-binding protein
MRRRLFLAASLALAVAPQRAVAQNAPVRIATIPVDTGMEANYAVELGFFTKAGLNADVQTIANGGQITAGVVSGSLDIGFSNILPVVQAIERGIPLVALFPGALSLVDRPNGGLVVTRDSPIVSARDLNGKTIGIPGLGNMTQLAPMVWTDVHGGDSKSLKFVEMPFASLAPALDQHRIDAAFLTEPFYSAAKQNDRVLALTTDAIAARFSSAAWFTTRAWADANPQLVARFITAMRETARWANTHPRDVVPLIAKYTKAPQEVIAREPPLVFGEDLIPRDFQSLLDASAKYGLLARPIAAEEFFYHPPRGA